MPQFCITQGGASKFAHNKSAYWPILSDDMILCLGGTYDIIVCRVPTPRGMRLTNKRKARGNKINIPLYVISFKFFFFCALHELNLDSHLSFCSHISSKEQSSMFIYNLNHKYYVRGIKRFVLSKSYMV